MIMEVHNEKESRKGVLHSCAEGMGGEAEGQVKLTVEEREESEWRRPG